MIETSLINKNPIVVLHVLRGAFSAEEALLGSQNGISIIKKAISRKERFSLIIDVRNYIFDDIDAHRIWSLHFKENPTITNRVIKVALVGNDEPKFRAEKQYLESENVQFFIELKSAEDWLYA